MKKRFRLVNLRPGMICIYRRIQRGGKLVLQIADRSVELLVRRAASARGIIDSLF